MIALPENADKATTAEWMGEAVAIARRLARMMGAEFVLNEDKQSHRAVTVHPTPGVYDPIQHARNLGEL